MGIEADVDGGFRRFGGSRRFDFEHAPVFFRTDPKRWGDLINALRKNAEAGGNRLLLITGVEWRGGKSSLVRGGAVCRCWCSRA